MKKKLLFLSALLLFPILKVNASTGLIDIYASNKTPTIGNNITITVNTSSNSSVFAYEYSLTYDMSKLKLVSSSGNCNGEYCVGVSTSGKVTDTFTFKVIANGNSTVSAKNYSIIDEDEKEASTTVSPVSISAKSATSSGTSSGSTNNNSGSSSSSNTYSTNNYLKSLSVDNYNLDKEFNKDQLDYKVTLDPSVEKIKINATAEDDKSTITGTGEVKVDVGTNKFEIVVTSEKGTTRTYTITAIIEDKHPIEVEIAGEKNSLVKRQDLLPEEEGFEKKTITIDDQKIPALYNKKTKYTLVGLKNEKTGKINLYIYDSKNNTYEKYINIKIGNMSLTYLDKVPNNNYKIKTKTTINNIKVTTYKINKSSKFSLLYLTNNETGKSSWYIYDELENTIQRYNNEELKTLNENLKISKTMNIALGIASLSFAAFFIISLINNIRTKNKVKAKSKRKKVEEKETKE